MKIAYSSKTFDSSSSFDFYQIPSYNSIIEIHVSCKDLIKSDTDNGGNPMCIIFSQKNGKFVEEDRTEVIKNNTNPNFSKTFKTYYTFNSNQPIRFDVYYCDLDQSSLKINDFIGYCETDVYHLITNLDQSIKFDIINDKKQGKRGQIILTCQQAKESNYYLQGELQVKKLKKIKTFSKDNPFFEILRPSETGLNTPVYRSQTKHKCYSCAFKEFTIPLHILCTKTIDEPITIAFYDQHCKKMPKFIGKYESSIREFFDRIKSKIDLKGEINDKNVGCFMFNKLEVIRIPTMVDYLRSGLNLNMITAIDFTNSNNDPKCEVSLHSISKDPNQQDDYQQCIMSVGSVLEKYVKDQKFPVFGFGAKVNKKASQCFPLTFNPESPEVNGLQGIIHAYIQAANKVTSISSTRFACVIKEAIEIALKKFSTSHTYSILFILTERLIDDMQQTINQIVMASDAPLSIIIVGVGNANFSNMNKLNANEHPLKASNGKSMKRNVVHFVTLSKIQNCPSQQLENELLEDIPFQIHQFCSTHEFIPKMEMNFTSCFV